MTKAMQAALLTTVNAPYQQQLTLDELAMAMKNSEISLGQVASFFTETSIVQQISFAQQFGISSEELKKVARAFVEWSGQSARLLA